MPGGFPASIKQKNERAMKKISIFFALILSSIL